jgi:signal transduction histidine kinase
VPGEIIIRETNDNAYIYKATLKVCLEQDYLKGSNTYNFKDPRLKALNDYSSQLIRELILPKITKEVNLAQRYASLRQVYYSLILAQWFKAKFNGRSGLYASLINRKNLSGITSKNFWSKTTYFKEYQQSFKDGEYNLKEPVYIPSGQTVRSYFSGGMDVSGCYATAAADKGLIHPAQDRPLTTTIDMLPAQFDSTETPYAGRVRVHGGAPLPPGRAQVVRGQSRSGASSIPAGSPLNVFDVLVGETNGYALRQIASLIKRSPATLEPDVRALVDWGIARKQSSSGLTWYTIVPLSPLQEADIRELLATLPRARPTKAEREQIAPAIEQILERTANARHVYELLIDASTAETEADRQSAFGALASEVTARPESFETLLSIFRNNRYYEIFENDFISAAGTALSLIKEVEANLEELPLVANMLYYFCANDICHTYLKYEGSEIESQKEMYEQAKKLIVQLDLSYLLEGVRIIRSDRKAGSDLYHELGHICGNIVSVIRDTQNPKLAKYEKKIDELMVTAQTTTSKRYYRQREYEASGVARVQLPTEIPAFLSRYRHDLIPAIRQLFDSFSVEFSQVETQLSTTEQEAAVKIRRLLSLADKKLRSYLRDPEDAYGEPENIDIIQIAQEAMEYYLNKKNINFRLQSPEGPIFVRMDELLALEVFFNLIRNAIDEIGEGKGEITVAIRRDGRWVRVEFLDTGGGIPAGIEDKIFEPRFTTKESGRGIGLYLCRRYIEAASGHITGTNRSDGIKGAVFTVTLPLHEPSSVDPGSSKPKGIAPEHGTSPAKASDLGGIDFRELPMVTQPMKVPAVNLPAPLMNQIDNLNLDAEWSQIRRMLDAGIIPSTERIKEYLQASYQKGITSREIELVLSGIACILRLEEKYIYATDPALKELLVHLESGLPG